MDQHVSWGRAVMHTSQRSHAHNTWRISFQFQGQRDQDGHPTHTHTHTQLCALSSQCRKEEAEFVFCSVNFVLTLQNYFCGAMSSLLTLIYSSADYCTCIQHSRIRGCTRNLVSLKGASCYGNKFLFIRSSCHF